jgi:hypothetical protein
VQYLFTEPLPGKHCLLLIGAQPLPSKGHAGCTDDDDDDDDSVGGGSRLQQLL